jgi:hypothetical protein
MHAPHGDGELSEGGKGMRTFVLGAGASLHVGYPLIKDLGRKLVEFIAHNPGPRNYLFWPDPDELKNYGPLGDIEEIVTNLERSEKPGYKLAGLREAVCFFFDSIRANSAPRYRELAREVIREGNIVITFNYDVSLERELRHAGKWEVGDGYGFKIGIPGMQNSATTLLKLHGSTNWINCLSGGMRGGKFSQGFGWNSMGFRPAVLPQEFEFLGYQGVTDPEYRDGGVDRSGSMILPSRNKRFYVPTSINPRELEDFWSALWEQAANALKNADEIAIIGYSLPQADMEARRLLLEGSNKESLITICCGQDTDRVASEFVQSGFSRVNTDSERFEDWLATQSATHEASVTDSREVPW